MFILTHFHAALSSDALEMWDLPEGAVEAEPSHSSSGGIQI